MSESDVTEENIGLARMLQRRLHGGERIDSDEVRKAQDRFKAMKQRFMPLNDDHLDLLFREARTCNLRLLKYDVKYCERYFQAS